MTSRDLAHNVSVIQAIAPQVLDASITGDAIDLLGHGSATLIVQTGEIVGGGSFALKLQESATGASDSFGNVGSHNFLGGTLPATLAANTIYKVGYAGARRFVRVDVTKASGTSIALSASIVKGHPASAPVS
ncbi:MAG: hypothetical protein HC900_00900 [Methylacidiphilales bacterium]|nr:hypothetical protein [Candidatus Methylacidiphilales bacterium]